MADQADLARDLLALAGDDLAAVRALVDVPTVSDAIVGFHLPASLETLDLLTPYGVAGRYGQLLRHRQPDHGAGPRGRRRQLGAGERVALVVGHRRALGLDR